MRTITIVVEVPLSEVDVSECSVDIMEHDGGARIVFVDSAEAKFLGYKFEAATSADQDLLDDYVEEIKNG